MTTNPIGRTKAWTSPWRDSGLDSDALGNLIQVFIGILPNYLPIVPQFIVPHLALMHLLLEDSPQETIVQAGGCEHSHIFGS
jgi:hypothetical protein